MQKLSTRRAVRNRIREGGQHTIGLDLGDRWSYYCVLDEARQDCSGTEDTHDTGSV